MFNRSHTKETKEKIGLGNTKIKINKICPQCGKEFKVSPSQDVTIYCSRICFGKSKKGKSVWNEGKKGVQVAWNKGKKHTKISGKNHYNWKGGIATINDKIRHNFEANLWKKACLERDNYTCQKYGDTKNLCVHHIKNFAEFPELRTSIKNGITLSERAHKEFHKIYGKRNNTLEQINDFICE